MDKNSEPPPPALQERHRLRLSGKATAFGLVMAFLITALLIPAVLGLKLPPWIEYELVLVVWWTIWLAVLTTLLYHGKRVADDHRLAEPRNWLNLFRNQGSAADKKAKAKQQNTAQADWGGWYWYGLDGEGCLWLIGLIVAAIALFFALWFLIEVAIPLLLFVLYLVPRGMLSHVINDRHHCKGRLARSLGWAFLWATLYTVPLAGIVWWIHFVMHSNSHPALAP